MTKLDLGKIPAHTVCPFRDGCRGAQENTCYHKGVEHNVPFSCGAARAFDLIQRFDKNQAEREWIGLRVIKKSGKPFKSGFKVNTVKGVTTNPHSKNRVAFMFEEDESFVNCELVKLYQP